MPTSADAYNALQSFKQTSPDAAISQGEAKYNVAGTRSQLDALRTLTGNLQNSIEAVDPSVTGRTQGSLVTEAQRQRIVNTEKEPLLTDLNKQNQSLSDVGHQYDEAQGLASNYANSLMANDKSTYDRLFGQYTTALQSEQQAASLAEQKRQFDAQLASNAKAMAGLNVPSISASNAPAKAAADPITLARGAAKTQKQQLLAIYNGHPTPFARERVLQSLQRQFPQLSSGQLNQIIYNEVFPNGWDGSKPAQPALTNSPGY